MFKEKILNYRCFKKALIECIEYQNYKCENFSGLAITLKNTNFKAMYKAYATEVREQMSCCDSVYWLRQQKKPYKEKYEVRMSVKDDGEDITIIENMWVGRIKFQIKKWWLKNNKN